MSRPESKRRRVSSYGTAQAALVQSSTASSASDAEEAVDEIPELLLELPKDNGHDVHNAVLRLLTLLSREESPQDYNDNRDEAIAVGMIGMLVFLVRKWKSQAGLDAQDILANTMTCLGFFADREDCALSIVKLGGIGLIVAALKSFPHNVILQSNGLFALSNTLHAGPFEPPQIQKEIGSFVTKMDGINLVVTAMKKFPDHSGLQANGCFTFYHIARATTHHEALHKSGATSAAATAVGRHFDDAEVKKRASRFLSQMFPIN